MFRRFKGSFGANIEAFERWYLSEKLAAFNGNVTQTARAAGVHRTYMTKLIRRYSLSRGLSNYGRRGNWEAI